MGMSFDQYQRYKTTELIVNKAKAFFNLQHLTILEIGANVQENLEKVLPYEDIYYSDIEIPAPLRDKQNYFVLDATEKLDIKDDTYDIVVALDVFEHIPRSKRNLFISELIRISKFAAIISFPENNPDVIEAEMQVNQFFKELTGQPHPWLIEHIENGLPFPEEVIEGLKPHEYFYFTHGRVRLWKELIKVYILYGSLELDPGPIEALNKEYVDKYFFNDVGERNYRGFLISTKEDSFINMLKETAIFPHRISGSEQDWMSDKLIDTYQQLLFKKCQTNSEEPQINASLFYDSGAGYNAEEVIVSATKYDQEREKYFIRFDINQEVKSIRFDPLEGCACAIRIVSFQSNTVIDKIYAYNATQSEGGRDIFLHIDPIYFVDGIMEGIEYLEITAEIHLLDGQSALECWNSIHFYDMNRLESSTRELNSALEALNSTASHAKKLEENLVIKEALLDSANFELEGLQGELKDTKDQLERTCGELQDTQLKFEAVKTELEAKRAHLEGIQASLSWRVTKPLRKIKKIFSKN